MNTTATTNERTETPGAQQLTLLSVPETTSELKPSSAHARFQLSKRTRERGLAHVAEIRRQLAAAEAARDAARSTPLPQRRPHAA